MPAITFKLSDFGGGLWLVPGDPLSVDAPGALLRADDVTYFVTPNGEVKLRGRRGRTLFDTLPGKLLGGWRFYPRGPTPKPSSLVVADDPNIAAAKIMHRHDGDAGFQAVPEFNPVFDSVFFVSRTARWQFTTWPTRNMTYMGNGAEGKLIRYDGNFVTKFPQSPVQTDGPFVAVWKDRLWSTINAELDRTVQASDVANEDSTPTAFNLSLNDPQGGKITGLKAFGDMLLATKQTGLWRFIGDIAFAQGDLAQFSDAGNVAPDSLAVTPFGAVYVGRRGLFVTQGTTDSTQDIAEPVRDKFVSLAGQQVFDQAVGIWFPRHQQYWVKFAPGDADIFVLSRIEVAGVPRLVWAKYTAYPLQAAFVWGSEKDDGRLLVGDAAGKLLTADDGATDEGAAFEPAIQTGFVRLADDRRMGRIGRVWGVYKSSRVLPITVRYDGSGADAATVILGTATVGPARRHERRTITTYTGWGRSASLTAKLGPDGPDTELTELGGPVTLRAGRLWRAAS